MSLIPDRYVCSGCGRYDLPGGYPGLSSSGCVCPRGSIYSLPPEETTEPTTKGTPDVASNNG